MMSPLDSNRAPFSGIFNWGIAKNHMEPCRGNREPDEPRECCVWLRRSGSDVKNGRVHYRVAAAKFVDTLFKPKSSAKIECADPVLTPTSIASSRTVIR
jgi:hypothetical protein